MEMASIDNWLTPNDVSEMLDVTPGRIRQMIADAEIPSVLKGHRRLIERRVAERLAKQKRAGAKRGPKPREKNL